MKNSLSCLLFLFFTLSLKATHNRSGEILYKRIAPYTTTVGNNTIPVYTYSITVIKYMDSGANVADRCADTISFGDGTKGLATRINGLSSGCNCGGTIPCGEIIVNNPNYVVNKSIYSITHTYSGAGSYVVSSTDPNRTAGVHNIPNSVNVRFNITSLIVINNNDSPNSSPVLTIAPVGQATTHICFTHNPGAIDAEGDSLSYEITPCNGGSIVGYTYPDTNINGFYYINATSGTLTWCSPQFLTTYNVAIKIIEWRKNVSGVYQLIGYVIRDMQIIVNGVGVVGIENTDFEHTTSISPNPFTDQIRIDFGDIPVEKIESAIYSSDGKLITTEINKKVNGNVNIDASKLEKGIYILRLIADKKTIYRKIVKD